MRESEPNAQSTAAVGPAAGLAIGGTRLVGREGELAIGRAALEDAFAGEGRVLLLAGEAGIGKSRFADALATEARARGARVLWGGCWEAGGAPAYWPWVQSIREYVRERDPGALRAELGTGAGDLVKIVPELGDLYDDLERSPSGDPRTERFRLFDSTARFFRAIAADCPLMVVLDDLHAADAPSLLLLRFVAGELGGSRILLVGAYRDTELGSGDPLAAALAELLRLARSRPLAFTGVGPDAVASYIERTAGIQPPRMLVEAIHSQTEGNPLFFGELVRLLMSERRLEQAPRGRRLPIPLSVREVIGRRLRRLSSDCVEVLRVASVLGREFSLVALETLAEHEGGHLLAVLDEASHAGAVIDVSGAPGRRRFAHALIRETLYEELPPGRRATLHRRCGQVLEQLYADDVEPHLAELAHHCFEAVPVGGSPRAIDFARRAGDRALALLAFEEAVRLYTMALGGPERREAAVGRERCELLLRLGDAQTRAGDVPVAQSSFLLAANLARELMLPEHLARAALGYGGRFVWEAGRGDRHLLPLLEEALRVLGDGDGTLQARLMARLAGGPLRDEPDRARRAVLSEQAVELARRLASPATLAYVLDGRYAAIWWPDNLEQRLGVATELVRVARDAGDGEREFQGRHYRCLALLERSEMAEVHAELAAQTRLADQLRQPAQHWYVTSVRATLATFEGRFVDADDLVERASALGHRAQGSMARAYHAIQTYLLRREQARLGEVGAPLRNAAAAFPTYRVLRCLLAHLHAELGDEPRARHALEGLLADDPAQLGLDDEWVFSACLLADVAAFVGDERRAAALYEALLPYAARNAGSNPDGCIGAVSRSLGVLASALGRFDEAERHFELALELNARAGGRPWVAQTRLDWARALLAREAPGDRERAAEHVAAALRIAREVGAAALEGKASELLGRLRTERPRGPARVFRREGEYWAIVFGADQFRMRDSKGLRYIADLLANPGRELSALALAAGAQPAAGAPGARALADEGLVASAAGDGSAVLDERARIAYTRRRADLHQELDEAERFNDPERAARARAEIDALTAELTAAVGLGGRMRRTSGPGERARQSVTKAIKAAIERTSRHSPGLAAHLSSTIQTGSACIYRGDPGVPKWEL